MPIFANQETKTPLHLTALIDDSLVSVAIEDIGPVEAKRGLDANTHNRKARFRLVASMVRDFTAGKYVFSGAPIVYSDKGVLIDGQHRLMAVVQSGVTLPMLVVRGVKDEAQANIDTGAKRIFGDVLTLAGYSNGRSLASAVRAAFLWDHGIYTNTAALTPTHAELLTYLKANPSLTECHRIVDPSVYKWRLTRSKAMLASWLFARIDPDENAAFWEAMKSAQPENGDPIGVFQQRMIRELSRSRATTGMTHDYELALLIKTWNSYIRGEQVVAVKWRAGGSRAEKFPQPVGPLD